MFDSWGKWVRVILTVIMLGVMVYFAPTMLDKLILTGQRIVHIFK